MLAVGILAPTAGADPGAADITVTHVAGSGSGTCQSAALASTATLSSTDTTWTIRIDAHSAVCGPISAAIYQMPNNKFYPWPQRLVESEAVDVSPGITTITFTKTCTPTQFDLVLGPTPASINPGTGPMVNLVYMFPWTGIQYWPTASCQGVESTTTLAGGTTTTTVPGATSTTTTTVAPGGTTATTTTVAVGATSVTTTTPNGVEAATVTSTTTPHAVEAAQESKAAPTTVGDLAFTGASDQVLIWGGVTLMALGILSSLVSRRRRTATL